MGIVFFYVMRIGLFYNSFCFIESYSKTGKLRTMFENRAAALKLEVNKEAVLKVALIFFAYFLSSRKGK